MRYSSSPLRLLWGVPFCFALLPPRIAIDVCLGFAARAHYPLLGKCVRSGMKPHEEVICRLSLCLSPSHSLSLPFTCARAQLHACAHARHPPPHPLPRTHTHMQARMLLQHHSTSTSASRYTNHIFAVRSSNDPEDTSLGDGGGDVFNQNSAATTRDSPGGAGNPPKGGRGSSPATRQQIRRMIGTTVAFGSVGIVKPQLTRGSGDEGVAPELWRMQSGPDDEDGEVRLMVR